MEEEEVRPWKEGDELHFRKNPRREMNRTSQNKCQTKQRERETGNEV